MSEANKRYQVFVSSTYADLADERRAVIQTIMELDCIPAGMEAFPAADEEQLQFIKKVIDDCDYYVLIVGGRYGSVDTSGVSYTQREYEYAVFKEIPVLAFLHNKPDEIPVLKTDARNSEKSAALTAFRLEVGKGRMVKMWSEPRELPGLVALSLSKAIKMKPGIGWVRGNAAANLDLLTEINELRKQNAVLSSGITPKKFELGFDVAGLETEFEVFGVCERREFNEFGDDYGVSGTWAGKMLLSEIFAFISPNMRGSVTLNQINQRIAVACQKLTESQIFRPERFALDQSVLNRILIQLEALDLIETSTMKSPKGLEVDSARLTANGTALMFQSIVKQA